MHAVLKQLKLINLHRIVRTTTSMFAVTVKGAIYRMAFTIILSYRVLYSTLGRSHKSDFFRFSNKTPTEHSKLPTRSGPHSHAQSDR